ncbi:MAG: VWA domain-containing protein [Desulfobacterales bacterium]|nr:VWA domain-containing protein [Desulfobacterales bacterium]
MNFLHIRLLFMIWLIPFVLLMWIWGMRRRAIILNAYASIYSQQHILMNWEPKRRWFKAALILLTLLFMIIAMSGPQYGYRWQEMEQKGVDLMLAIDCSRSMLAQDIKPTRLDRAKREIIDLLAMLKGDRIGLVAFSGIAFLQCPLTLDYSTFNIFLENLTPDFLPVGGTNLSDAITVAISGFNIKDNTEKAIILITDGENTGKDVKDAVDEARKANIKIFSIGVGKDEGIPIPDASGGFKKDAGGNIVLSKLDEATLKQIAENTNGAYVRSIAGDMDLDMIYSKHIKKDMQDKTLTSSRKKVWEDRYQWCLAIAILFGIWELLYPAGKFKKRLIACIFGYCLGTLMFMGVAEATNVYDTVQKGLEAYNRADYDKALKYFIDAQLEDPERPEVEYNLGNVYYRQGDFANAAKHFSKALSSENVQLKQRAQYNLGNALYRQGKYDEAIAAYEAALKLNSQDKDSKENLEFVKQVQAQVKEQQEKDKNQCDKPSDQKQDDKNQQQSDDKKSDDDTKENKEQKDQPSSDENKQEKSEQEQQQDKSQTQQGNEDEQQQQSYGKEMNEDQQPSGGTDEQKEQEQKETQAMAQGDTQDKPPEDQNNPSAAERLLNRLKDQPGRVMIPMYEKRQVEKDW